jgi:hypothetical protein
LEVPDNSEVDSEDKNSASLPDDQSECSADSVEDPDEPGENSSDTIDHDKQPDD